MWSEALEAVIGIQPPLPIHRGALEGHEHGLACCWENQNQEDEKGFLVLILDWIMRPQC